MRLRFGRGPLFASFSSLDVDGVDVDKVFQGEGASLGWEVMEASLQPLLGTVLFHPSAKM